MTSQRRLGVLIVAAAVAALSACGSAPTEDTLTKPDSSGFKPITIDNCGYEQKFDKPPSRVVLMQGASVGEVETFILLDVDDSIVANAQYYGISDIPKMAKKVDEVPKGNLKLNEAMDIPSEQLTNLRPDLVVSTWSGGFDPKFGFASRETLHKLGIRTLVNPANCAYGKPKGVSAEEKQDYDNASVESSSEFIELIGQIYGKQDKADKLVSTLDKRIEQTYDKVKDAKPKRMLIAFPSMAVMNANGLPAVFSGGYYDSLLEKAGGVNAFQDGGFKLTASLSPEQLASAKVEVLVLGAWRPNEDLDAEAEKIFKAYPQWPASRTKTYVKASDGLYLGPANADAIEKIAKVAHPEAFK